MSTSHAYKPIDSLNAKETFSIDMAVAREPTTISSKISSKYLFIASALILVILALIVLNWDATSAGSPFSDSSEALFDNSGRYILRNFDAAKPMANFLAGVGGYWGIPMWVFYVNRGQGVTSFGLQNKDGAISLFNTAEKAYQQTPFTGFRTFLKGERAGKKWSHMPFFPLSGDGAVTRDMKIGMNEMEIEEVSNSLGLKTNVLYFTMVDEEFPALVRKTTFTNLDPTNALSLEALDGLGRLVPSGLSNWAVFAMGRTTEAWMKVFNVDDGDYSMPFFHITQGTADVASVQPVNDGHFTVAFIEGEEVAEGSLHTPLPFIVDPSVVFNTDTTLIHPRGFFGATSPALAQFLAQPQGTTSRTPCSFAGASIVLQPGQNVTIVSVYGHAKNLDILKSTYAAKVLQPGFLDVKYAGARGIVEDLTKSVTTTTSSPIFDAYIKQDYLDNILRGGRPVPLGNDKHPKIYHTFSRIHGDIERDYNNFQIDVTYFSQGPGNFRDVCQNRRLDVLLAPVVGDFNIRMFLSFVQADAYNPLTVASTNFRVSANKIPDVLSALGVVDKTQVGILTGLLAKAFRIGQLFVDMNNANIFISRERVEIVNTIMSAADQVFSAQFVQNGFWADHWTYTLDLVQNFLSVFPDQEETMLWDSTPVPFFMSPAIVKSRVNRYNIAADSYQTDSTSIHVDNAIAIPGDALYPQARVTEMSAISSSSKYLVDAYGAGGLWQRDVHGTTFTVSAIAKLTMLGVIKFSTVDPFGMGIEMEGGKPGWNDAMNGLPGLLGSGMPETFEMLQILRYVSGALTNYGRPLIVPSEFADLLSALLAALIDFNSRHLTQESNFAYWDATNNARETYRQQILVHFNGTTSTLSAEYVIAAIAAMEAKTLLGIEAAHATNDNGVTPTYFFFECTDYDVISSPVSDPSLPLPPIKVRAKSFILHSLPLFLEGPTRNFKVITEPAERLSMYQKTKASKLYDSALQMYTISESLDSMHQDVGRMKAFAAGWLENQSVWLHMSYKFYLELLRAGLYEEFFAEIKTGLVPFMDHKTYGRSPLEATSFIVSSAFPDPKLHGAGFLARLSGSTAEFLSMWAIMTAGPTPFVFENGQLLLKFAPVLPDWLFTTENTVSFTFLGVTAVVYHNPNRVNTWEAVPILATVTLQDGSQSNFQGAEINAGFAERVRDLEAVTIDVYF